MKLSYLQTAVHEAAHAEVARHFGRRLRTISICHHEKDGWTGEVPIAAGTDPFEEALISLAGTAADHILFGQGRTKVSAGDHEYVVSLGFQGRSLSTLLDHAEALVKELTPKIMRRAAKLVARLEG